MAFSVDGMTFRSVSNTDNGDVDDETIFRYRQQGSMVTATYSGGRIVEGHIIGRMLADGRLDLRYHHLNGEGVLMAGTCLSTPELLPDGRLGFHERWQWLTGDGSAGESRIEEVPEPESASRA